jgi:hypothetical protein
MLRNRGLLVAQTRRRALSSLWASDDRDADLKTVPCVSHERAGVRLMHRLTNRFTKRQMMARQIRFRYLQGIIFNLKCRSWHGRITSSSISSRSSEFLARTRLGDLLVPLASVDMQRNVALTRVPSRRMWTVLNYKPRAPSLLDFVFADDAGQASPTRPGMGPLIATGGFRVESERVGLLNFDLETLCRKKYGFPEKEEFKWSPSRSSWMWSSLKGTQRERFYRDVISTLSTHNVTATVVIVDEKADQWSVDRHASVRKAVKFFLERADQQSASRGRQTILVVDKPGGGRREEREFLDSCTEVIESGTDFVRLGHIAHAILTCDSDRSRLLQAADLVTSATAAYVAGNVQFSASVFKVIQPLLYRSGDRVHGYGLKIFPDFRYANLFHWLLGEQVFWRGNSGDMLPTNRFPYSKDPMIL